MPFIKKNDPHSSTSASGDGVTIFVGRQQEVLFFLDAVLIPDHPVHNIVSIYGEGGVGKSTFLQHLLAITRTSDYRDYCVTAYVDERQATAASIMEKFAEQLRVQKGAFATFDKALQRYKKVESRQDEEKQDMVQDMILQRAPDLIGAVAEGLPFVGPLAREGVKATTSPIFDALRSSQNPTFSTSQEDLLRDLTKAFVADLNRLVEKPISRRVPRHRRLLLFFDTFEQMAMEAAPWLLDHFLMQEIDSNIVLVVAGRSAIDREYPNDPKRWLPFKEQNTVALVQMTAFTEQETRQYLLQHGIYDEGRMHKIWQLSHGLPLYLGLLTTNNDDVDPTSDVVENFLRWLPEHEEVKRRLVLDAALFAHAFNQDDLAAFTAIPASERGNLYRWLLKRPFGIVMPDGGYRYHDVIADLFSRYLYQHAPETYWSTRRALAEHYRYRAQRYAVTSRHQSSEILSGWLAEQTALLQQLFLLPDRGSHCEALEGVIVAYELTRSEEELARVLTNLKHKAADHQLSSDAFKSVKLVQRYLDLLEHDPISEALLATASELLTYITAPATGSPFALASVYKERGVTYRKLKYYQQARADFDQALALAPDYASAYGHRGSVYRWLKQYDQALQDYDQALRLDESTSWTYVSRGVTYFLLKQYDRALQDFERAIELDPYYYKAFLERGRTYNELGRYEDAITAIQQAIQLAPDTYSWLYGHLGEAYRLNHQDRLALENYTKALEADPDGDYWIYGSRGLVHAFLRHHAQALADFDRALALNPDYAWGYGERGRLYRYLKDYQRSLTDLRRSLQLNSEVAWTHTQIALTYLALQEYDQALNHLEYALRLAPQRGKLYGYRGSVYLAQGDLLKAQTDYEQNLQFNPHDIDACWLHEWIKLCQQQVFPLEAEERHLLATRLEHYTTFVKSGKHHLIFVCRGVAHWLQDDTTHALTQLATAQAYANQAWDAPFWQGLILGLEGQPNCIHALELALKRGIPRALLAPLHWIEQVQPELYTQVIVPLLKKYR